MRQPIKATVIERGMLLLVVVVVVQR